MQFQLTLLGALAAIATATPLAMPAAAAGTIESRQDSNCTQYCSVSAGCVCTVRPSDCTALYEVQPNDNCLSIAKSFGNFTVNQVYKWNPNVGQTCFGLQAYVPICINTPWYEFTPPVQSEYGTKVGPEGVPVPVMPNIIESCQTFELVAPGKRVDALAEENGFDESQFAGWNGNSTTAWVDYWACVKA